MNNFDLINVLYYCFFGLFVYYQQLHVKNFRGSSQIFQTILSLFAFAGMITGLVFLVIYGIKVIWWAPIVLLILSILSTFIGVFIEKLIGKFIISIAGFIAWPILAYLMFKSIPY
jgi:hypothetical protein